MMLHGVSELLIEAILIRWIYRYRVGHSSSVTLILVTEFLLKWGNHMCHFDMIWGHVARLVVCFCVTSYLLKTSMFIDLQYYTVSFDMK